MENFCDDLEEKATKKRKRVKEEKIGTPTNLVDSEAISIDAIKDVTPERLNPPGPKPKGLRGAVLNGDSANPSFSYGAGKSPRNPSIKTRKEIQEEHDSGETRATNDAGEILPTEAEAKADVKDKYRLDTKRSPGRPPKSTGARAPITRYEDRFIPLMLQYFDRPCYEEKEISAVVKGTVVRQVIRVATDCPSLSGFASTLGCSKPTILGWAKKDKQFKDTLDICKQKMANWLIVNGINGLAKTQFASFVLKNTLGWQENPVPENKVDSPEKELTDAQLDQMIKTKLKLLEGDNG